jgi:methionyl aminopeptidase
MIIKNQEELKILREGGKILASVLNLVANRAVAGASAFELDRLAESEIRNAGGTPSFKNFRAQAGDPPFPASLCVSVNDEVVHGFPSKNKVLKDGDIVGLDLGLLYKGLYTDMAVTVAVGKVDATSAKLIEAAKECLSSAIKQTAPGKFTGDIGAAIEATAKKYGFQVVRELVGHGVGKSVHEEPEVPCFGKIGTGTKLVEGLVIAVEPMINAGKWKIIIAPDNWTIKTEDGSLSAHIEHTLLVTKKGCEILTKVV